jgi:PAS domain S-box-containing protein
MKSPGYLYQLTWEIEATHNRVQLRRRQSALQESEERFRKLADTAPVFVWTADPNGLCDYCNKTWLDFIGSTMEEQSGAGWTKSIHPEDMPHLVETFQYALERREEFKAEFRVKRSDGEDRWIHSNLIPRFTPSGEFMGYVGSGIDMTERIEAQASLERALTEVKTLKDRLQEENVYLQAEIRGANNFGEIIGQSVALKKVLRMAEQVAPGDTTVMILGETGTGKELLAHAIHNLSPRSKQPLVKVNCAALPAPLIETELFGHAKGAYTGADTQRTGRFELANQGTIFLDEVGELPLELQAKLLRVLEEGEFERVGDSRTISVTVRVITATNRNLEAAVAEGRFRSDLYYRLSIFPITVPPLRERREDIPLMIRHFVQEFSRKLGKQIEAIPHETMTTLRNYPWPGNIRELRNVIERAVIITQGPTLRLLDSLDSIRLENEPQSAESEGTETLESNQYNLILKTLKKTHWRIEGEYGAAAALRINPSTLRTRMKKLGIRKPGGSGQLPSGELMSDKR